jgi:hypothetical protein
MAERVAAIVGRGRWSTAVAARPSSPSSVRREHRGVAAVRVLREQRGGLGAHGPGRLDRLRAGEQVEGIEHSGTFGCRRGLERLP